MMAIPPSFDSHENPAIPTTQKAVIAGNQGKNYTVKVVEDYPVPKPTSSQILVRLTHSGICHSDLSCLHAEWDFVPPAKVPGHEGVGRIVARGSGVSPDEAPLGLKVGVPLISNPCNQCEKCLSSGDGEIFCEKLNAGEGTGFYGEVRDGTWQQYVCVEKSYLIPVPEECDDTMVGPVLCGGVTVYKGLKKTGARAGKWVVIPGCGGGLGTMAIQYAREAGFRVIGIDAGSKREMCLKLGAEEFIDFTEVPDLVARVMEITRIGAHAVLVLSPIEKIYNMAVHFLREEGCMVCIGLPPTSVSMKISPHDIINKLLTIKGSLVGTRSDMLEALDFVSRGKVVPQVKVYKMEQISEILELMETGKLLGRAVISLE